MSTCLLLCLFCCSTNFCSSLLHFLRLIILKLTLSSHLLGDLRLFTPILDNFTFSGSPFFMIVCRWRPCPNVGVLTVGPVMTFCHPVIELPIHYVLRAEDSNVAMMTDITTVGLGHQRNGVRGEVFKDKSTAQLEKKWRGWFAANPPCLSLALYLEFFVSSSWFPSCKCFFSLSQGLVNWVFQIGWIN